MENKPLVSICIPAYNGEHLITRALDSCLKQTYQNLEILVIDDCSKDNTIEVVKEYQKRSDKIRLIANEVNLGASKNFLKTFQEASGVFVQHIGQDDWLDENYIEEKVRAFDENPNVAFVGNPMKAYEKNEKDEIVYTGQNFKKHGIQTLEFILRKFYKEPGWLGFSCMMRKKDAVEQYLVSIPNKFGYEKFYEKAMAIDNILLLRILSLPQYNGKYFYTTKTFYNTLSHSEHYSKDYGWMRSGNISDWLKFAHIDRVGYEFFLKTHPNKYLFFYRFHMGNYVLGNLVFDFILGRAREGFSFEMLKFFFQDYSFVEKFLVCLNVLPNLFIRTFRWGLKKFNKK